VGATVCQSGRVNHTYRKNAAGNWCIEGHCGPC
jgi:hypothetical protein